MDHNRLEDIAELIIESMDTQERHNYLRRLIVDDMEGLPQGALVQYLGAQGLYALAERSLTT